MWAGPTSARRPRRHEHVDAAEGRRIARRRVRDRDGRDGDAEAPPASKTKIGCCPSSRSPKPPRISVVDVRTQHLAEVEVNVRPALPSCASPRGHGECGGRGVRRPVRGMGDVHGDHVGDVIDRPDEARVIGHRERPGCLEEEHRVVGYSSGGDGELVERLGPARLVKVFNARRGPSATAMPVAWPTFLRGSGKRHEGGKGECSKAHGLSPLVDGVCVGPMRQIAPRRRRSAREYGGRGRVSDNPAHFRTICWPVRQSFHHIRPENGTRVANFRHYLGDEACETMTLWSAAASPSPPRRSRHRARARARR